MDDPKPPLAADPAQAESIGRGIIEASESSARVTGDEALVILHRKLCEQLNGSLPPDVRFILLVGHEGAPKHNYGSSLDRREARRWLRKTAEGLANGLIVAPRG